MTNKVEFSGSIERLKSIQTKTGNTMASWLLKVGQDKFKCVAFKNVAEAVLQCKDGDKISVSGTGSINSWEDDKEHWNNDFQLTAWLVEIDERLVEYEKDATQNQGLSQLPQPQDGPRLQNQGEYAGGPF
jgi:single-stranded DNA-binding protein